MPIHLTFFLRATPLPVLVGGGLQRGHYWKSRKARKPVKESPTTYFLHRDRLGERNSKAIQMETVIKASSSYRIPDRVKLLVLSFLPWSQSAQTSPNFGQEYFLQLAIQFWMGNKIRTKLQNCSGGREFFDFQILICIWNSLFFLLIYSSSSRLHSAMLGSMLITLSQLNTSPFYYLWT